MRLAGTLLREEMAAARADERTERVAQLLLESLDERALLFAVTALNPTSALVPLYSSHRELVDSATGAILAEIRNIAGEWRRELTAEELGRRKGAFVERLVELLVERRIPGDVHREGRVELSDGRQTSPFDVLGAPPGSTWEGIECKSSYFIANEQAADLRWCAKHAREVGDELQVVVASAAGRDTLVPALRGCGLGGLVFYVSSETIFDLRTDRAIERC